MDMNNLFLKGTKFAIFSVCVVMMALGKEVQAQSPVSFRAKAGVGIGGEGYCTMTIAGPTGEGITCAKSFCRRRRCMLAEGGLRIV